MILFNVNIKLLIILLYHVYYKILSNSRIQENLKLNYRYTVYEDNGRKTRVILNISIRKNEIQSLMTLGKFSVCL